MAPGALLRMRHTCWANWGELVGTVGCEQTRARLPFCSQNAKRDEKAMAMSHGAAALAGGERER